ncbi:MAG: hypothetical protein K8S99_09700 [Planctomycetes bacterium]|nr:hypothetical protein [Planctomycetota bacterium]
MSILARIARLSLCSFWAGAMLLAGLWLLTHRRYIAAEMLRWLAGDPVHTVRMIHFTGTGLIAGAQYLFMFLVADDLCPDAPIVLTGFLELFTAVLALGSLAGAGWLAWAMMPGAT